MVEYKKGKAKNHADALSRVATPGETTVDIDDKIPCLMAEFSMATLGHHYQVEANEVPQMDIPIPTTTDTGPSEQFERISLEEFLKEQHTDGFRLSLCSRLSWTRYSPFTFAKKESYPRTSS